MQIFPKSLNLLPLVAAVALAVGGGVVTFIVAYYFSYWNTQVGYAPVQPVPFSHRLHAGQLGMDCRYCHANVERSGEAMVPATQTCMGCHAVVRPESAALAPVRESWQTGNPVEWVRVHNLPDHAYFDHSVHLSAGVGCASCHGRIDQMEVVTNQTPLSMSWCLDCHRNPEPNLRPVSEITNMAFDHDEYVREHGEIEPARYVLPPENCSGCHR
jgi:Cytochrome c7 and related cytochrome c/Class III cytochrome C family